ncbi:hypothetical protein EVAR_23113_1 [Eumeta japonica]|uniref:Uncharacterized protein n=1 Tax=Eumeta variegata TaxID=151549 RepID=A0A4C1VN63_EUMVA|nr:hypothetical protein EVAR_23113_1 [Eumeta japonica]
MIRYLAGKPVVEETAPNVSLVKRKSGVRKSGGCVSWSMLYANYNAWKGWRGSARRCVNPGKLMSLAVVAQLVQRPRWKQWPTPPPPPLYRRFFPASPHPRSLSFIAIPRN